MRISDWSSDVCSSDLQPNIFLNSYLGYTMWDYESDAPQMWPGPNNTAPRPPGMSDEEYQKTYKQQHYPTAAEVHKALERNPEGASPRGLRSEEHTSELQSLMRISYAVFCLKKKNNKTI